MSLLMERFREEANKSKDIRLKKEADFSIGYPTRFLPFDFMNGTVIHVNPTDGRPSYNYNSIGFVDGRIVMFIGRSSCGKTTLCLQMAGNIVRPFKKSGIFHDDIEGGIVDSRKEQLLKMTGDELKQRYICRDSGINSENFYQRIKMIHDLKLSNYSEFEYDTGMEDSSGARIYKLEPTVYILDSLALLTSEKYTDEEELSGQMSTTASARQNASIFRKIIPMLKAANIILFVINHILDDISINPMQKKKGQLAYIKQGETLPGGKTPVYLSNNIIRCDDNSKLKESEGFGFHGSIIDVSFLKSRTSSVVGKGVELMFNFAEGFDEDLSMFLLLKEHKRINGAGAFLFIDDHSDIKFAQKNFKEKLRTSRELREYFMQASMEVLQSIIGDSAVEAKAPLEDELDTFDMSNEMFERMHSAIKAA